MIWLYNRASDLTFCVSQIHGIFKTIENFIAEKDISSMVVAMSSINKLMDKLFKEFTIDTPPSVDDYPLTFIVRSVMLSVNCHIQSANLTMFYLLLMDMIPKEVPIDIERALSFDLNHLYRSMFDSAHQQARLFIQSSTILRGKIPFIQIPLGRALKTCVVLLPFRYHSDSQIRSMAEDDLQNLFPVIQEIQRLSSNEIVLSCCFTLLHSLTHSNMDLKNTKEIMETKTMDKFIWLLSSTKSSNCSLVRENFQHFRPPFILPLVYIPEQIATESEEIRHQYISHNRHCSYPFLTDTPASHSRNIYHTPTKSSQDVRSDSLSSLFDSQPTSSSLSKMSRFSRLPPIVPPALLDKRQQSQLTTSSTSFSHISGISSFSQPSTSFPSSTTTNHPLSSAVSFGGGRSIFSNPTTNTSTSLSSTSVRSIDAPYSKQSMEFVTDKASLISLSEASEQSFSDNQSFHENELLSLDSMLESPPATTSGPELGSLRHSPQLSIQKMVNPNSIYDTSLPTGSLSKDPESAVLPKQESSIFGSSVVPISRINFPNRRASISDPMGAGNASESHLQQ
ncbi:unnamed protein product [Ambrosiozyma monospora]|uniref:Unnamed protein product n=1 Tax=Ambrosiozyma monospora TaxID=43982 RepID=A0ACB5TA36_AMBMO|nr:unnamed protein product [Ambrosiozyma monospora]